MNVRFVPIGIESKNEEIVSRKFVWTFFLCLIRVHVILTKEIASEFFSDTGL